MTNSKKRIEMSDSLRGWLKTKPIFPKSFVLSSTTETQRLTFQILDRDNNGVVLDVANRMGYKGFVLRVEDLISNIVYAAKFSVPQDYDNDRDEITETRLSAKLQQAGILFSRPQFCGRVALFENMPPQDDFSTMVCFISEWVEGETLESFIQNKKNMITPYFVCELAKQLNKAINFLEKKDLKHDDLHCGNIMISHLDPDLILEDREKEVINIRIIDTGSLKSHRQETNKSYDDMLNFTNVLVELYNALLLNRKAIVDNAVFFKKFKQFIDLLTYEDPQRALPSAHADIQGELIKLESYLGGGIASDAGLIHPFDAISAEHLASDEMLLRLFVKNISWLEEVSSKVPIVLTGPRGCGKSMILRYLSVRTHLHTPTSDISQIKNIPFFGVFISCSTELQNSLSMFARSSDEQAFKMQKEIITFFNLIVARELFRAIGAVIQHSEAAKYYGIFDSTEDKLISSVSKYLTPNWMNDRFSSTSRSWQAAEELDRLRIKVNVAIASGKEANICLPANFLSEMSRELNKSSYFFSKNPIAFLLDDYTSYRVPICVQKIINKIIFERRPEHVFKISCEKYGFVSADIGNIRVEVDREFHEVDAGSYFLGRLSPDDENDEVISERDAARNFITTLLDYRLEAADWNGRISTLIGPSDSKTYIDLARAIHENKGAGSFYCYYGMEILSDLWSGDVATMLHVVRTIFSKANVGKNTTEQISKTKQHDAIVSISRSYRERIVAFHPHGPEIHNVVAGIGAIIRNLLIHAKPISRKDSDLVNPRMVPRIEMTLNHGEDILEQLKQHNPLAAEVAKELLRRAIFIELHQGRAKEKNKKGTVRWELRRIYLPGFGAALGKNHYIDIKTIDEFVTLLTDDKSFNEICSNRYLKEKDNKKINNTDDLYNGGLFPDH